MLWQRGKAEWRRSARRVRGALWRALVAGALVVAPPASSQDCPTERPEAAPVVPRLVPPYFDFLESYLVPVGEATYRGFTLEPSDRILFANPDFELGLLYQIPVVTIEGAPGADPVEASVADVLNASLEDARALEFPPILELPGFQPLGAAVLLNAPGALEALGNVWELGASQVFKALWLSQLTATSAGLYGPLAPETALAQPEVVYNAMEAQLDDLRWRLNGIRGAHAEPGAFSLAVDASGPSWLAASDPDARETRFSLWARGGYTWANQEPGCSEPGYDWTGRRAGFGGDVALAKWLRVGLAAGFVDGEADVEQRYVDQPLDADQYFVGGYLSLGPVAHLVLDLSGGYAWDDLDFHRNVDLFYAVGRASGEAHGTSFGWDAQLSSYGSWWRLRVTPFLGARGIQARVDGYSERGLGSLSVAVSPQTLSSIQSRLGLELSTAAFAPRETGVRTYLSGEWVHEFQDNVRDVDAHFRYYPEQPFTLSSDSPDRDFARIIAGFDVALAHGVHLDLRLTGDIFRAGWERVDLSGGLRVAF